MKGGVANNSPYETPKQTPSGHAMHRRRYSTHGTPAPSSAGTSSSYVVKIASVLLLLWTIAYAVVCFRFISREEIDIAPEVPIFNNYNPFSSFGQVAGVTNRNGNGPQSNRFIKSSSSSSGGGGVGGHSDTDSNSKGRHNKEGSGSMNDNSVSKAAPALKRAVAEGSVGSLENLFVSNVCKATYSSLHDAPSDKNSVSVIIPSRNEEVSGLIATVTSILKNSGGVLKEIIVVDDASIEDVSLWGEWKKIREEMKSSGVTLVIHRMSQRQGVALAKAKGASLVNKASSTLVFLDAHSIVSKNWLTPLLKTLQQNPNSVVYPAIDVIDGLAGTGGMIQGDNAIAAFDWSMRSRWEFLEDGHRLHLSENADTNEQVFSPAMPGTFAVQRSYFEDIGGFDEGVIYYGTETVELSLRIWLCGGVIIKQPCSRVAHSYHNLDKDIVNVGVPLGAHDKNARYIAEHWLTPDYREVVFQALFIGRVPYPIQIPIDSRLPPQLHAAKGIGPKRDTCQSFDWYLNEIYQGLKLDISAVGSEFGSHLKTDYLSEALKPLMVQYAKGRGQKVVPPTHHITDTDVSTGQVNAEIWHPQNEVDKALSNSNSNSNSNNNNNNNGAAAAVKSNFNPILQPNMNLIVKGEAVEISDPVTVHEKHIAMVKETLSCVDEVLPGNSPTNTCNHKKLNGQCTNNLEYMLFGCPKTCGLCADGKLCADFFMHKCPNFKKEKGCLDPWMKKHCMVTCEMCNLKPNEASISKIQPPPQQPEDPVEEDPVPEIPEPDRIEVHGIKVQPKIDPTVSQQLWKAGMLPDPSGGDKCKVQHGPNGKLLSKVTITTQQELDQVKPVRIFCGTYTMEKNHKNNVATLRNTWGKRCDGWVAFSTKADPSIPAISIEHEGEESYDNMWQKSRSIWRYVAVHYAEEFDWFLLGGDDMYYMIENLRYYLGSEEIQLLQESRNGMFLGRRFFPPGQKVFNSGGAGYLLDKKSLMALLGNIDTNPKCWIHQKGFWEDVNVANCLKISAGIEPFDTRDSLQRERFHPFTPGQHLEYRAPPNGNDWYVKYNPELKYGYDCCSDRSISWHYAKAPIMQSLHDFMYHCPSKPKI